MLPADVTFMSSLPRSLLLQALSHSLDPQSEGRTQHSNGNHPGVRAGNPTSGEWWRVGEVLGQSNYRLGFA